MATIQEFNDLMDSTIERINALLPLLDQFEAKAKQAKRNELLSQASQDKLDAAVSAMTQVVNKVDVVAEVVTDQGVQS